MRKTHVRSITLTITLIILIGFVITGICTYLSFQSLFKEDVESVSELTSENIYVNISNLMDRPINVSTTMAHDTFLRDFMDIETTDGLSEEGLNRMQKYLKSYQEKYQFDSVFFVSAKTNAYYHFENGIDRVLTPGDPENEWYYDFLKDPSDCSLNVDNDEARENLITIFVNCKLYDENEDVIGIVGVGMVTPYIQDFLLENESEYDVHAFLIDKGGNIQVSSTLTEFEGANLFKNPDYSDMAKAIDTNTTDSNHKWYHSADKDGYVITKFIPNLNWYLVVEKSTQEFMGKMIAQLLMNFAFLLVVALLIILFTTRIIRNYDSRLKDLAEIDQLTGIGNRMSYEWEISKHQKKLGEYDDFGIGVCDLNDLKLINDYCGHQAGDECLKTFSDKLSVAFENCQVFRIGGDEFAIIFKNMTEKEILERWCNLSDSLNEGVGGENIPIHVAFGYSFRKSGELDTIDKIFRDADDKMYINKKKLKSASEKNKYS